MNFWSVGLAVPCFTVRLHAVALPGFVEDGQSWK